MRRRPSEPKGLRHDADGQDAGILARDLGNDRSAPPVPVPPPMPAVMNTISVSSSALAMAGCGSPRRLLLADLGVGARALAVRQLFADLDVLLSRRRHVERLLIGIHRDEVDAARIAGAPCG